MNQDQLRSLLEQVREGAVDVDGMRVSGLRGGQPNGVGLFAHEFGR